MMMISFFLSNTRCFHANIHTNMFISQTGLRICIMKPFVYYKRARTFHQGPLLELGVVRVVYTVVKKITMQMWLSPVICSLMY